MKKLVTLLIFLAGIVASGVFFSDRLAGWALQSTIREAKDLGIEIALNRVHWREAEISLQIPRWKLSIPHAKLQLDLKLLPPSIEVIWREGFPELRGEGIALSDLELDMRFVSGLSGDGFFYGKTEAKKIEIGKYHIASVSLKGEFKKDAQFELFATWAGEKIEIKGKSAVAAGDLLYSGPLELSFGKNSVRGSVELRDVSSGLRLQTECAVKIPDVIEANKVNITAEFGSALLGKVVVQAQGFKSAYVWLNSPVEMNWSKASGGTAFVVTAADFDPFLPEAIENVLEPTRFGLNARFLWQTKKTQLTGGGALFDLNRKLRLDGKLSLNPSKESASVSASTNLEFGEDLSWKDLFQEGGKKVESIAGRVKLQTSFEFAHWTPSKAWIDAELLDLGGVWWKVPVEGLSTKARIDLLPVVAMKTKARINVDTIGSELSLNEVATSLRLTQKRSVEVDSVHATLAKGKLEVAPFEVDLANYDFETKVILSDLEMAPLLAASGFSRLSGKGKIGGVIPIRYEKGDWVMEGAKLRNVDKGVLSYQDESTRHVKKRIEYWDEFQELLAQGNQVLVMKALDDFHYELLELRADRSPAKGLAVEMHLRGRNPDLAKGQLFEINLPITGALESLLSETVWKGLIEKDGWEERWEKLKEFR